MRTSDEAERVQTVSYSHIRSLLGLYTVVQWLGYSGVFKRRQARHLPWAPSSTVMCLPCFQRDPRATAMYKWATLLSKGPQQQLFVMCKYLASKGAQSNCNT